MIRIRVGVLGAEQGLGVTPMMVQTFEHGDLKADVFVF